MNNTFEFDIKDMDTYLLINLKGGISRDDACSFTKETIEFAEQKKVYKFLFNARQATITGGQYSQQFFALLDLDLIVYNRPYQSAILINPVDTSHYFIVKALNDNNHNAKLFTNANKAKKWLINN